MRRLMSDDGGLKLPTKQAAFLVNGIATEILLTHFGDRIFIAVTQLQKLGTIIHAASDKPVEIEGHPTFTVKILLGKDEPILEVYARRLMDEISRSSTPDVPVLLAIALTDHSPACIQPVLDAIIDNKVW
ncbi:proteasome assembly chaperone 3-like isoform X1 [Corticium candelabrum]|uniref:proteasome assembly chaperone 3-like isoform X1 n=1 Tax=Corticium candelabrum TaxID=121492 RepID=UPI002E270102|nr:proteasome assembly chaperone 3-like isoform X1 [Corticium candelabrum]